MGAELDTRLADSNGVFNRWMAIAKSGGRTESDFMPVNPDLDAVIAANSAYLARDPDPGLRQWQDILIQQRQFERGPVEQLLIGAGLKVNDTVAQVYNDARKFAETRTPTGTQLTIGLVAVALIVVLVVLGR